MQCRSSNCYSGNMDTSKMQQFAAGPAITKVLHSNATVLQHTHVLANSKLQHPGVAAAAANCFQCGTEHSLQIRWGPLL